MLFRSETKEQMIKEIADIKEVIYAICDAFEIDFDNVIYARSKKAADKGIFELGCYLESVEDEQ